MKQQNQNLPPQTRHVYWDFITLWLGGGGSHSIMGGGYANQQWERATDDSPHCILGTWSLRVW